MKNCFHKYRWLLPAIFFTILLIAIRMVYTSRLTYAFIPWNLLLAAVPLLFSNLMLAARRQRKGWLYCALWLLFFPNSAYIITDLFHLRLRPMVPLWYDLLLLVSASATGALLGFLSLRQAEVFLRSHLPRRLVPAVLLACFVLCGYGIYLGRYLRWNSWDIVMQPFGLLRDIAYSVLHPFRNLECWGLSLLFGAWMFIVYSWFVRAKARHQHAVNSPID